MFEGARRLLVTGGAGFIGGNFLRHVSAAGSFDELISVDLNEAADLNVSSGTRLSQVRADVRDYGAILDIFDERKPDVVVHFAAETHVDKSIVNPLLFASCNYMGTAAMLEVARRAWLQEDGSFGGHRFIQVSTDEVYGSHDHASDCLEFIECSSLRPSSPYSASKAAGDLLALSYRRTYGFPVLISRSCNNYGPRQLPDKLIPKLIGCALRRKPLPLYGNGSHVRTWMHVDDHCAALRAILVQGSLGETYNVGSDERITNLEVAQAVIRICREETGDESISDELISFVPDRPGHDFRYDMSIAKAQIGLNWRPQIGFEEGLRRTVQWYLDHPEWLDSGLAGGQEESGVKKTIGVTVLSK